MTDKERYQSMIVFIGIKNASNLMAHYFPEVWDEQQKILYELRQKIKDGGLNE